MMKNRRKQKATRLALANLTYYRLKNDLQIIEADIQNNQPLVNEEQGVFKKVIGAFTTEIQNEIRRKNVQEMTSEKKAAIEDISYFEQTHGKELDLIKDTEKFKKFMQKELFKKDKYDLAKMQFAFSLLFDNTFEYRRAEQSLAAVSVLLFDDAQKLDKLYYCFGENFKYLHNQPNDIFNSGMMLGMGLSSFLSLSFISLGVTGVWALIEGLIHKNRKEEAFKNLSLGEVHAFLALKLTLIQQTKATMPHEEWKSLIDDCLKYVENLRSDAQYEWLVERSDAPLCKEKIEVCDLCIARLAKIIGV